MRRLFSAGSLLSALVCFASFTGCEANTAATDATAQVSRSGFLLDEEPDGAVQIAEAKALADSGQQVVVFGQITAGKESPWHEGFAMFMITDPIAMLDAELAGHDHADGHDHANCPFCNKKSSAADTTAIVQFVDSHGKVLSTDARQLLGVAENQFVVVRGQPAVDGLGHLVITADGLYIRQ